MAEAIALDTFGGLVKGDETPEQALRRLEKRPTFAAVIGTDVGQRLLEAATAQIRNQPNGGVAPRRSPKLGLPEIPEAIAGALFEHLPLDLVDVGENIRGDPGELAELVASISELGVLQPIRAIGPHADGRYRAVFGQRRLMASRLAGRTTIPALVEAAAEVDRPGPDRAIEQLSENLQRKDLNPIEEAFALRAVLDATEGLTQDALASKIARSGPWVSNTLRLLSLDDAVQQLIRTDAISASHGKAIASLPERQQRDLAASVVERKMSAHDLEREIKWKQDAALQDANKAAKTERMTPRVMAALEKAATPKMAALFIHGPWDVDVDAVVRAVKKAGWKKAEQKYTYGGRPEGCDCTAVRVEISGRSPSLQPTCTETKHQTNGRDAEEQARRAADAERQRLGEELREVVRIDLDIARSRHTILALISWALEQWHDEAWDVHVAHTDDELLDDIAKAITVRMRDLDLAAIVAAIRATQGPGNAGSGPETARQKAARANMAAAT